MCIRPSALSGKTVPAQSGQVVHAQVDPLAVTMEPLTRRMKVKKTAKEAIRVSGSLPSDRHASLPRIPNRKVVTARTICRARIRSAFPRCRATIVGGSSMSTVTPPSAIWMMSSTTERDEAQRSPGAERYLSQITAAVPRIRGEASEATSL